jgi:hypothetical protein
VGEIQTGRFEKMMSGLTAVGAAITAVEIWSEHDGASFGNKMMWLPIVVVPTAIPAGIAAVFSRRMAKTVLPLCSAVVALNGLHGMFFHLASMVGGMGLLAAVLRREDEGTR